MGNVQRILMTGLIALAPLTAQSQGGQQNRVVVVEGKTGQAAVIQKDGRTYVDLEALTQITKGSLSFDGNRIILNLPGSNLGTPSSEPPPAAPHAPQAASGLSREFMRAGIEEFATMREWASTLAYAIQNGYQVTEEWVANYREQAARNLSVAASAASTSDDHNALQLLTHEFQAVQEWSDKLVQERKSMDTAKYALSPGSLREDPQSQKIIACGRFLAQMLGSGSFQDDPSCH